MLKTSGILLDFPLPRYEGCDNWNNLPGKIATHQKTVSVTRSADQHRFGLLTIDKTGSPNWIILWQKMLYPCIVVPLCTDASYYQLELSAPNSWINPFHEKLFEYSGCRLPQRHSFLVVDSPYISWSTPNFSSNWLHLTRFSTPSD
jgi:hypothetical protein